MIRIGCNTLNFGPRPLEDALRFIRELGFTLVDVAANDIDGKSQVDQRRIAEAPEGMAIQTKEVAKRQGVELDELFMCPIIVNGEKVQPNQPDDGIREQMLENFYNICRYAHLSGFKSVMGVPGVLQESLGEDGSFWRSAETLKQMVRIAADQGLKFNVESHRGSIIEKPEAALRLAREVRGLGYTVDFLHFIAAGVPQAEAMPLLDYAGHVHARQASREWPKCLFEQGEIDYAGIVRYLKGKDWVGSIALEYWNGPRENEAGINPVFQNVLMANELEKLIRCAETGAKTAVEEETSAEQTEVDAQSKRDADVVEEKQAEMVEISKEEPKREFIRLN